MRLANTDDLPVRSMWGQPIWSDAKPKAKVHELVKEFSEINLLAEMNSSCTT